MKVVFSAHGLPGCDWRVVLRHEWERRSEDILANLERALGFPMFVKPANLGSSVGISKAKDAAGLREAIDLAGSFDRKVVVEAAVPEAREIECAVLGNDAPQASVPGRDHPVAGVLRLRGEVPGRRLAVDHSGRSAGIDGGRDSAPRDRGIPVDRLRRHGARRLPALAPHRAISTSTKSTRFRASRRSACTRRCGRRPACRTGRSSIALVELALERHALKQQLRTSLI